MQFVRLRCDNIQISESNRYFGRFIYVCTFLMLYILFHCHSLFSFAQTQSPRSISTEATTPHPAVVRVTVPHFQLPGQNTRPGTTLGSGILIAKKANYGFIITNWHVVNDSNGFVKVRFPNKQEYEAAVIAVDDRWDLALLIIPEPKGIDPVPIAKTIPTIGETYYVAGYRGDGSYRVHAGRFLKFKRPEAYSVEAELIEIEAPSESGDSGGPVFNNDYQLVGVLFGSDEIVTVASHCGRVIKFLVQAESYVAGLPPSPEAVIKAASLSQQSILQRGDSTTVAVRSNAISPTLSSSTSFGGGGSGSKNNLTYQRLPQSHMGFMTLSYDITAGNALLATEHRSTPPSPVSYRIGNSTGAVTDNVSMSGRNTTVAPNDNNTVSYSPTNRQSGDLPATTVTKGVINNSPSVTQPSNRPFTNNTVAGNTLAIHPVSIPVTTQPVSSPVASPLANPNNHTNSAMAVASPSYGGRPPNATTDSSSVKPLNIGSNPVVQTTVPPPRITNGTGNASTWPSLPDSTPGGIRTTTEASQSIPQTNSGQSRSSTNDYSTYGSNATPSASAQAKNNTGSQWSDDDLTTRYALDASGMQPDDFLPKYSEEFPDPTVDESIAASSQFDAVKIVIAILVIFFILFHTVKTMAIAEERQGKNV
ncbi:MAG: trypsin-like peptidase domain-containing protein [Planctomycetaceae bacterium]|nr:trypsin-like peptidase domain-containing protein [Planctomycetaceae bacterium]